MCICTSLTSSGIYALVRNSKNKLIIWRLIHYLIIVDINQYSGAKKKMTPCAKKKCLDNLL